MTARHILVATDLSDNAAAALAVGVTTARALGARLHLLHVFTSVDDDATRLLADAAAKAGSEVSVVATSAGDPAREILRYAARQAIDLIVIGTHGRTGVTRVLLGSVAERVVRGAHCPVLVVPAAATVDAVGSGAEGEREVEGGAPRRCLVCAASTADLICEPCRARIRGEALEHKYREERAGRT
jgi:nucleotide-binding universal stress UspA family protein